MGRRRQWAWWAREKSRVSLEDKDSSELRYEWELMRTAQGRSQGNHRKVANRRTAGQDVFNHVDVHSLNSTAYM